jgi:uncharacterized damage-inducible protein DinB
MNNSVIMKQLLILCSILMFSTIASPIVAQERNFINDYIERLENSHKYILKVAEMMPADNYKFRVTTESKSFEENLMHIAWAMDWHSQSLLGGRPARDWETDTELRIRDKSKEEMIATLDKTFNETIKLITAFDTKRLNDELDYFGLNRSKRQILLLLADHITHHRAQMLLSLRLKGLVPPRYVLYQ